MVSSNLHVGCYAPDFELPGIDGSVHHLRQYLTQFQSVGVVFLSYDCDQVLPALEHLMAIQAEFAPRSFTLIGIDADAGPEGPSERLEAMASFAQQHNLSFPYLRDENQDVAETFGVTHSPHAFLVNQQGMISYSGSIWGSSNTGASEQQTYFWDAIAALLKGQTPPIKTTPAQGCLLKWRPR